MGLHHMNGRSKVFLRENRKWPKPVYALWSILLILILLSSCGDDEPAPTAPPPTVAATQAPAATATSESAKTSPLSAAESPLAPTSPLSAAATNATTGSLSGQIVVHAKDGDKSVQEMIIALAAVIRDDKGIAKVAGYDASNSPNTLTDAEGKFTISDVPPGTYALILDAVLKSHMLTYPATEETILVDIKAGESASTGLLEYDSLPLPGYSAEE